VMLFLWEQDMPITWDGAGRMLHRCMQKRPAPGPERGWQLLRSDASYGGRHACQRERPYCYRDRYEPKVGYCQGPAGPGFGYELDEEKIGSRTESCETPHFPYHVSGRLYVQMTDGTECEAEPGQVTALRSRLTPGGG